MDMSSYNYQDYQCVIPGVGKMKVGDMSLEQLRSSLCDAIYSIEMLEEASNRSSLILEHWRKR